MICYFPLAYFNMNLKRSYAEKKKHIHLYCNRKIPVKRKFASKIPNIFLFSSSYIALSHEGSSIYGPCLIPRWSAKGITYIFMILAFMNFRRASTLSARRYAGIKIIRNIRLHSLSIFSPFSLSSDFFSLIVMDMCSVEEMCFVSESGVCGDIWKQEQTAMSTFRRVCMGFNLERNKVFFMHLGVWKWTAEWAIVSVSHALRS